MVTQFPETGFLKKQLVTIEFVCFINDLRKMHEDILSNALKGD